jgi:hypothetical protein
VVSRTSEVCNAIDVRSETWLTSAPAMMEKLRKRWYERITGTYMDRMGPWNKLSVRTLDMRFWFVN